MTSKTDSDSPPDRRMTGEQLLWMFEASDASTVSADSEETTLQEQLEPCWEEFRKFIPPKNESGVRMMLLSLLHQAIEHTHEALQIGELRFKRGWNAAPTSIAGNYTRKQYEKGLKTQIAHFNKTFGQFLEAHNEAGLSDPPLPPYVMKAVESESLPVALELVCPFEDETPAPKPVKRALVMNVPLGCFSQEAENVIISDFWNATNALNGQTRVENHEHISVYFPIDSPSVAETVRRVVSVASRLTITADRLEMSGATPFVISCDILDGLVTFASDNQRIRWPREAELTKTLSAFTEFEKGHDSFRLNPRSCLLVTDSVYRVVQNHFSFEPVGRIGDTALHRVWPAENETQHDALQQIAEAQTPAVISGPLQENPQSDVKFLVGNDCDGQQVADAAIRYISRVSPEIVVLHWQCHQLRSDDLLNPVTESLRRLFGLNRRTRNVDLEQRIQTWISDHGPLAADDVVSQLSRLMLGSEDDTAYDGVVNSIANLLCSLKLPICIVAENLHTADELTNALIRAVVRTRDRMRGDSRGPEPFIICTAKESEVDDLNFHSEPVTDFHIGNVDQTTPFIADLKRNEKLWKAVKISAVLGWEFLRSWLRDIWTAHSSDSCSTKESQDEQEDPAIQFEQIMELLLRKKVLQYSGLLADIDDRSKRYREVKFCSTALHNAVCREIDAEPEFRQQVSMDFLNRLEAYIAEKSLQKVRCKIRVCRNIKLACRKVKPAAASILVELLVMAGSRAYYANALATAANRLETALEFLNGADVPTEARGQALQTLALLLAVYQEQQELTKADNIISCAAKYGKESASKVEFIRWFDLCRALWSWQQRFGNLSEAEQWGQLLASEIEHAECKLDRQLEIAHLLCVTYFSLGKFENCVLQGNIGREVCEEFRATQKKTDISERIGSHDGGACCKLFAALAALLGHRQLVDLLEEQDAEKTLLVAHKYASDINHRTTKQVVRSYTALFHICRREWEKAIDCIGSRPFNPREHGLNRWDLFERLMLHCAHIGQLKTRADVSSHVTDTDMVSSWLEGLASLRNQWGCHEYGTVWATFQAVGHALLPADQAAPVTDGLDGAASRIGDTAATNEQAARQCFQHALDVGEKRQERFFLPEIYALKAWFHRMRGEHQQSADDIETGLQIAGHELKSDLFTARLKADPSS